jgi:predicted RND superfamily exporter protein
VDATSEAYLNHQKFVETFGHDEFMLLVLKSDKGATSSAMLEALQKITRDLEQQDKVTEVVSLADLKVFQKRGDLFGNYPFLQVKGGVPTLPDQQQLETLRKALPITDLLLSRDLKTVGVLVKVDDEYRFDTGVVKQLLATMNDLVKKYAPPGTEHRIIGGALIRQAIVRYNIQTGIIFGCLCMLIGTVVSVYVFKSFRVTVITNAILAICVLWVLGLMAVLRIPLNSTTALSFGFIPIATVEIVIHMVVRYHQFHQTTPLRIDAIRLAVRWLARPCLICSTTTAVGFGTLMVSSIPMVRQLGFIMSVGILISYGLTMILTPALFSILKSLDKPEESTVLRDWFDRLLGGLEQSIFSHPRVFVAIGLTITAVLFAGAPFIKSDPQILRMLKDSTPEVQDLQFVETNLSAVHSVELTLEAGPNGFKNPAMWRKVEDLERKLARTPEVISIDSMLPLLQYLSTLLASDKQSAEDFYSNPALIPQLLGLVNMSPEGKRVSKRFLTEGYDTLHLSIRIKNSETIPIGTTIQQIRDVAESVMGSTARVIVTGDLAVVADQTSNLITDQIRSMFLAAFLISILMVIQLGSVLLGVISLIPNIPPVAAVFGIMGWGGISLDAVTVFAATVAIGLAVDNTIHYLTQLKREISLNPEIGMKACVARAYRLTAKQIASWCIVTLLGFLALSVSPFRPVVFFGILGCSSILLGLYGDLIFLQSLILSSRTIQNTIRKLLDKESRRSGVAVEDRTSPQPDKAVPPGHAGACERSSRQ